MNFISKKHKSRQNRKYNKQTKMIVFIFIVFFVLISLINITNQMNSRNQAELTNFDVIQVEDDRLTFNDILNSNENQWKERKDLRFGFSQVTYWVRFKINDLHSESDNTNSHNNRKYLSLFNTTVESVLLYVPLNNQQFVEYKSGWRFSMDDANDERFIYPLFELPQNRQNDEYYYLKLFSSYSTNYSVSIYDEVMFERTKINTITVIVFMTSLAIAAGLAVLIQFSSLRFKVHFYYIYYLMAVIFYELIVLGAVRIHAGSMSNFLIRNVASFAMFMVMGAVQYMRVVLKTKNRFPKIEKLSQIVLFLCFFDVVLISLGYYFWGNLLAVMMSYASGFVIIIAGVLAVKQKISYSRYMLTGWILFLLVSIVFNLRGIGILPNNEVTFFLIMLPIVVETYLMSMGLSEMVQIQEKEKNNAIRLYQLAEYQSISNETAFLQAQIKPHFLFNSLTLIEATIYHDAKKAAKLLLDFSTFLKHSFDSQHLNMFISFEEELEFIKAYVSIEQARFPNMITVDYELDDTSDLQLPPLIIQPLLENAIRHGIRRNGEAGKVTLRVKNSVDSYTIEVEDDGVGMTPEQLLNIFSNKKQKSKGVGLSNIQKRLHKFYETDLKLESTLGFGTKATIVLLKDGVEHESYYSRR